MDLIEELDVRAEVRLLSSEERGARSKALADLWALLRTKDAQNFQRSRSKWLKEGDANT
ncbi:cullin 3B, partial [Trifolium medium]|nr:cullin 3B [Trifolium medium]